MKSQMPVHIFKHTVYTLLLLLLYVLQTTPGFLAVYGVKPIWVASAAISISMFEGEFTGGIYGAVAGLLCDSGSVPRLAGGGSTLFGFNGFFLTIFCVIAGLLVIYMMRCNLLSCILFVFVSMAIWNSVEFLFAYGMWGHENVWKLYVYGTLPVVAYSVVTAPLSFWTVRWIHRKFELPLRH